MLININKTENIIKKYYKILKYINNKINNDFIFERIDLSEQTIIDQLNENINGKFTINDIKKEIIQMKYIYKVSFEESVVIIFSKTPILNNSINLKCLIKIIKYLQNIGSKDKLTAYLYLSESKRIVHNSCFNVKAVNGGYTRFGDKKMVVWRKEDGIKVFIHELIHYFDIDKQFRGYGDINNYTNENVTNNSDLSFEAFTDFIAINFYMVYLSLIANDVSIKLLQCNFCDQYNFSLLQGFKIIKFSKINDGYKIINTTNVYSYYLLKLYIMIFYRNSSLSKINIDELVKKSLNFYKKPLIKKYINKIKLDNKINMAYKQIYL